MPQFLHKGIKCNDKSAYIWNLICKSTTRLTLHTKTRHICTYHSVITCSSSTPSMLGKCHCLDITEYFIFIMILSLDLFSFVQQNITILSIFIKKRLTIHLKYKNCEDLSESGTESKLPMVRALKTGTSVQCVPCQRVLFSVFEPRFRKQYSFHFLPLWKVRSLPNLPKYAS